MGVKAKRRRQIGYIVLCGLAVGLYVFRHNCLVVAFDLFLEKGVSPHCSRPVTYDSVGWREGQLVVTGVNLSDEQFHLAVDKVEVGFRFDWSRFYFESAVHLVHPELTIVRGGDSAAGALTLAPLLPGKFQGVRLDIQNGVLQLNAQDLEQRLYFSFVRGEDPTTQLGTFFLSYDPDLFSLPTTEVGLSFESGEVSAGVKIAQMESRRLLQLVNFFYPSLREGWENVQGDVEVMASATFSPDLVLARVAGLLDAREVYLANSILGMQAKAEGFHAEFTFPPQEALTGPLPFWKQVRASATVAGGEWTLSSGAIGEVNAHLLLDPELDPLLELTGVWMREGKAVPLVVKGKGSVLEDQSFWLELGVSITPLEEQAAEALVSVCSSEKEAYVVQVECTQFDVALLEMFGSPLPLVRGTLGGKVTGWVAGQRLEKIQIDDLRLEDAAWTIPHTGTLCAFPLFEGEAVLSKANGPFWEILSLKGEALHTEIQGNHTLPPFATHFSGSGATLTTRLEREEGSIECHFDTHKNIGWLKTSPLTEAVYQPWITAFFPQVQVQGELEVVGTISFEKLFLSLQGNTLLIDHPFATFQCNEITHPLLFSYLFSSGAIQAAWSVEKAQLAQKNHQLYWENFAASCEFDGEILALKGIDASCEEVHFVGDVEVDFSQDLFTLTSTHFNGPLAPLEKVFGIKIPVEGQFSSWASGISIVGREGCFDFLVEAELSHLAIDLNKECSLEEGKCLLTYDSKENLLTFKQIQGDLLYQGHPYHLTGELRKKEWWEFDAIVAENLVEIARVAGIAQELPYGELHVSFEKNTTHLLGIKLSINRLIIKDWKEIVALEMNPFLQTAHLAEVCAVLHKWNKIPCKTLPWNLEGEIHTRIAYEGELTFELAAPSLSAEGIPLSPSSLRGTKSGALWNLEGANEDQLSISAQILEEGELFHVKEFTLSHPQVGFSAEAIYESRENRLSGNFEECVFDTSYCDGIADGSFTCDFARAEAFADVMVFADLILVGVQSRTPLRMLYRPTFGLLCENLDLNILGREGSFSPLVCKGEALRYDGEKWVLAHTELKLSPDNDSLENINWFPPALSFRGEYAPLAKTIDLASTMRLGEAPLYCQLHIDYGAGGVGMLKISEDPTKEGIRAFVKDLLYWERLEGELPGLKVDLSSTSEESLEGSVTFDFSKLTPYLPPYMQAAVGRFKLGSGYRLDGEWDPRLLDFKGTLTGHEFEVLGYRFHRLESGLSWTDEQLTLENFKIEDLAGKLSMKQGILKNTEPMSDVEVWKWEIPLLKVYDLQPSRLRKMGGIAPEPKPLIIKTLSFYEMQGILGEGDTVLAQGEFNFINGFRKEFSLLDFPLDFLKNIGLDPGLLTPVYGEGAFQLKDEKMILTDLVNTYSDGRRSEFYLPHEGSSFLDFAGNISLDLKMKQNVLLNVTEPFTLTVRGTLDNPKYSLVR